MHSKETNPSRPPLASISITDAHIDAVVDDLHLDTREVDLDVSVEEQGAFEIAVRAGTTEVTRTYRFPGREDWEDAVERLHGVLFGGLFGRGRGRGRCVGFLCGLRGGDGGFGEDMGVCFVFLLFDIFRWVVRDLWRHGIDLLA